MGYKHYPIYKQLQFIELTSIKLDRWFAYSPYYIYLCSIKLL
ncbi:hypothetical protein HMPREF9419_0613 [Prevotella nigrescens ATCC 33563]|nr:hypothetical protein HMPREF9419_0613 [Prevotella nigrescens ATCC 33563]